MTVGGIDFDDFGTGILDVMLFGMTRRVKVQHCRLGWLTVVMDEFENEHTADGRLIEEILPITSL